MESYDLIGSLAHPSRAPHGSNSNKAHAQFFFRCKEVQARARNGWRLHDSRDATLFTRKDTQDISVSLDSFAILHLFIELCVVSLKMIDSR